MNLQNAHIEDFLDYFFDLPNSPEYAVMLKGPWGCGKTWFINHYCEKLEHRGKKHLFISLYGIRSFAEIDDAIFSQIHPFLSSKGMAITGKLLKGILKTTIKIDLNDLEKENIPKFLSDTSDCILIFDDLERCQMNINDVLGYINQFVEHHGHRIIIIANEDEILEKDKYIESNNHKNNNNNKALILYKRIKEKLIGITFEVFADVDALLDGSISTISDEKLKDILNRNRKLITELYWDSKYKNLRLLKQCLLDFERLFIKMPHQAQEKEPFIQNILALFLIYSFEIKSGAVLPSEIGKIKSTYFTDIIMKEENRNTEVSKYDKLRAKYSSVSLNDTVIDVACWEDFFVKGMINSELIEQSILKSSYFQDANTPNWVKLWHFTDYSDEEYRKILNNVEEEYFSKNYEEIGVIKQVTGILLFLSEVQLYDKHKDDILGFAKTYVDHLIKHEKLSLEPKDHLTFINSDSWGGLEIWGKEIPEFKDFIDYLGKRSEEARIKQMPDVGKKLIKIMETDTLLFGRMLTLSDTVGQKYYDIPILKHIVPEEFVESFLKLKPDNKKLIRSTIKGRYQFRDINKILTEELDWWKCVHSLLSKKMGELRGKVSGYVLQTYIDLIQSLIIELEKTSSE